MIVSIADNRYLVSKMAIHEPRIEMFMDRAKNAD